MEIDREPIKRLNLLGAFKYVALVGEYRSGSVVSKASAAVKTIPSQKALPAPLPAVLFL